MEAKSLEDKYSELAKSNPVIMELELFSKGLRLDGSVNLDGKRPPLRLRAGLGSGLEMKIGGINDWRGEYLAVNAPIHGEFVKKSPYLLMQESDRYFVTRNGEKIREVFLYPLSKFYQEKTTDGVPMNRIGCIFGNVGSMMINRCEFWSMVPKQNCSFCATGVYYGDTEEPEKTVSQIVEVSKKMVEDGVDSLHFNTGYRSGKGVEEIIPIIEAVFEHTDAFICVQCPPAKDFGIYEKLYEAGARHVSFCFELNDPEMFGKHCPGKLEHIGKQRFFDAIEHCVGLFPDVAGEIIAGLEDVESTMEGIEKITDLGAWPTVTIFRPLPGTELSDLYPPATDQLIPIVRRMYTACIEKNINIEQLPQKLESLSPLPLDGKLLLDL